MSQPAFTRATEWGEDNCDAQRKRQVMGREVVVVAVSGGKLESGPWERNFYGGYDGRRRERVRVKVIGDGSDPSGGNGR